MKGRPSRTCSCGNHCLSWGWDKPDDTTGGNTGPSQEGWPREEHRREGLVHVFQHGPHSQSNTHPRQARPIHCTLCTLCPNPCQQGASSNTHQDSTARPLVRAAITRRTVEICVRGTLRRWMGTECFKKAGASFGLKREVGGGHRVDKHTRSVVNRACAVSAGTKCWRHHHHREPL